MIYYIIIQYLILNNSIEHYIISYYIIFQCIIYHYIIILISDYEGIYLDLVMSEGLGQKYGGPRRQAQEKIRTTGLRLFIIITFLIILIISIII